MGVRQQGYWLRQAAALDRRAISSTAYAVTIGMADGKDRQKAIDALELVTTTEEVEKQLHKSKWSLLSIFGGKGTGV